MNMRDFYAMKSEEDDLDLGTVYAETEETLRLFGSSYMRDKETPGSLKIVDPQGITTTTFDVWQNKW
ncbi:MAG: hypothetical protein AAGA63_12005 [Pseudomonadota bacterium]